MDFDGQVWFDFVDDDVWQFYRFVRRLASEGNSVALEWRPLPTDGQEEPMVAFESLRSAGDRGRFLHAMLGLVHIEELDPSDPATLERAVETAKVVVPAPSQETLDALRTEAAQLGVRSVPSLYRRGPIVVVRLNAAALEGDIEQRAATILAMASDDGIWELSKP
jgi:protein-disulfide isomerase